MICSLFAASLFCINIITCPHYEYKEGIASWYDYSLSGIQWSRTHNTCATRDFKRYAILRVKNLENDKTIECYNNDYIEHPDRIIDLSSHAFSELAPLSKGLIKVSITYSIN